jgi:hypothetical protein
VAGSFYQWTCMKKVWWTLTTVYWQVFHGFFQSLQAKSAIIYQSDHSHFIPNHQ